MRKRILPLLALPVLMISCSVETDSPENHAQQVKEAIYRNDSAESQALLKSIQVNDYAKNDSSTQSAAPLPKKR